MGRRIGAVILMVTLAITGAAVVAENADAANGLKRGAANGL